MSSVFQKTNRYVSIISDVAFKYWLNAKTYKGVLLCKIATNHYNKASVFVKINHFLDARAKITENNTLCYWRIEINTNSIWTFLTFSFWTKFVNFVHCASSCTVSNSKQNKKCVSPILSTFGIQHSGPGILILSTNSTKTPLVETPLVETSLVETTLFCKPHLWKPH